MYTIGSGVLPVSFLVVGAVLMFRTLYFAQCIENEEGLNWLWFRTGVRRARRTKRALCA